MRDGQRARTTGAPDNVSAVQWGIPYPV